MTTLLLPLPHPTAPGYVLAGRVDGFDLWCCVECGCFEQPADSIVGERFPHTRAGVRSGMVVDDGEPRSCSYAGTRDAAGKLCGSAQAETTVEDQLSAVVAPADPPKEPHEQGGCNLPATTTGSRGSFGG